MRLHVAEAGDPAAPPVLLLHGWPQNWWAWREIMPRLAADFRVLAPDLRGFGWSDVPRDGYDKEQLASDQLATLDALEVDRVTLVGHDWGGVAAFLMCLRAPDRVERFVALNTGHPWLSPDARAARNLWRFAYQPLISTPGLGALLMRRSPMTRIAHRLGVAQRGAIAPEDVEILTAQFRDPARARAAVLMYRTFLLREAGPIARGRYAGRRLTMPLLWLHGAEDVVIRPHMVESVRAHADDVQIEYIPDAGHFIAEEQPELVAGRIRAFATG